MVNGQRSMQNSTVKVQCSIGLIALFMAALPLKAQDTGSQELRQTYALAEELFRIGRLEETIQLLEQNVKNFHGTLRQHAYRLIALSHLAMDNEEAAEKATILLLDENPYYTSVQDPPRFVDIINRQKEGRRATVTTASSQAETLSEVPVPTTLITQEMIRYCGARNLQEVLVAYVPGMNIIDSNDDINIAMHGIYSNGQEKILFMLNGHRLNSYATNVAAPDFSISLEKLKQIEVLRGPASSLYGGVALTGVVNLITMEGAEVDGIQVKGGIGNYGQLRGDMLMGKRFYGIDLLLWGSIYKASGEKHDVSNNIQSPSTSQTAEPSENIKLQTPNEVTIGGTGNKPSCDFGIQLNWKEFSMFYNTRFSQVVSPYTISTTAKPYNYDKYMTFNGLSPSFANNAQHATVAYNHKLGNLKLGTKISYDNHDVTQYQVISDYPWPEFSPIIPLGDREFFEHPGLFRYINLQEKTYGLRLNADYSYVNNSNHKGSLAFGTEYSHFNANDFRYVIGHEFNTLLQETSYVQEICKGHENSGNVYLQLKHRWKSFILNAGVRYDFKKRTDNYNLQELSPRAALILLQPKWNVKLCYSKAFVDAPYIYRKINTLISIKTNQQGNKFQLHPETEHSFQLTFEALEWVKGLTVELNAFHNDTRGLICTEMIEYTNEGYNKTIGLELTANYRRPKFTVDFNLTWSHVYKSLVSMALDVNNNLPAIMSHTVLTWKPLPALKLFSHLSFESKQTSYNIDINQALLLIETYNNAITDQNFQLATEMLINLAHKIMLEKKIDARFLCDVGAEYQLGKLTLGLNVNNLFNTKYYRSGMNTRLVPQRSRWFMFSIGYNL